MDFIFQILQISSGLLLILFILLHSPKGDGMAAIGGASQLFSSQKGAEVGLTKITTFLSFLFVYSSLILGFDLAHISGIIITLIVFGLVFLLITFLQKKFFSQEY